MVYGSDLFNLIKFGNNINSFQPILPLIIIISAILIVFVKIDSVQKFFLLGSYISLIELIIVIIYLLFQKNGKSGIKCINYLHIM